MNDEPVDQSLRIADARRSGAAAVIVCGEALMDVFAAGDTDAGMALDASVGRSPFSAAVGLRGPSGDAVAARTNMGHSGRKRVAAVGAQG